jgi:RimJ/RimL family protein N-acetyltransferase
MEPLSYLHLQMRLEGLELIDADLMRQVEPVPGEELPFMLIARLAGGELVTYYGETISGDLQKELGTANIRFPKIDPLIKILQSHNVHAKVGYYKTYTFPSLPAEDVDVRCLAKDDPQVKVFGFDGFARQVYAIERDDRLVSACVSARENAICGEAWVYTTPEYRNQGFAQKVVNAWARNLMEAGKIPFYSHKTENRASANLAGRLGLCPVFEEISIAPI